MIGFAAHIEFKPPRPAFVEGIRQGPRFDRLAASIDRALGKGKVSSVATVPGTDLCVGLVGVSGIVVASLKPDGSARIVGRARFRREPHMGGAETYHDEDVRSTELRVMRSSKRSKEWCAVILRDYGGGDCNPWAAEVAQISSKGIGWTKTFGSLQGVEVYPPDDRHGMVVAVVSTFKVWWPEAYEWRDRRFVLADTRHPEFYSQSNYGWTDGESDHYYPMWMNRAAIYDIHRQFRKALSVWKRAERSCIKTLHTGNGVYGDYRDVGFYGEAMVNLREIRKRIAWLKKREYNHPLLYRPYDFELQVPPYRLGSAKGVQYGG